MRALALLLAGLVLAGCLMPGTRPTPSALPTLEPTILATATPVATPRATPVPTLAPTPTLVPTELPSPTATPLIKDYRCFDGTPQNQCSKVTIGMYCGVYVTYEYNCKLCGCPAGKTCSELNICK